VSRTASAVGAELGERCLYKDGGLSNRFTRQDQAHLPNERISLANLRRGKSVIERFLVGITGMASS
jgi:acetylornithine deacetylase/succinyl-diaminopimelate desuccinylase-like protein